MWGHIYINRNVSLCCHWKQHTCLQVQMTFVLYECVTRTAINTAFSLGTPEEAQSTQTCPLLNHHPHSAESTHHDISLVFPCSVGIQNWKHWLATPWTTYQLYHQVLSLFFVSNTLLTWGWGSEWICCCWGWNEEMVMRLGVVDVGWTTEYTSCCWPEVSWNTYSTHILYFDNDAD